MSFQVYLADMRILILTVTLLLIALESSGQYRKRKKLDIPPIDLIGRANVGFGFNYQEMDFQNEPILYSPGGGMGLEIGGQTEVYDNVYAYFTMGWHQNLRLKLPNSENSQNRDRSSFVFARFPFTLGANYVWTFDDPWVQGIIVGGGLSYNKPSRLKLIENNDRLGLISYNGNVAVLLDFKIRMELFKGFYFDPGIRYRRLKFRADEHAKGNVKDLPNHLRTLNASGLDFSATFVYDLKPNRR